MRRGAWLAVVAAIAALPTIGVGPARAQAPSQAQAQDVVVDRILALVNNDVITLSDVRAARRLHLIPTLPADASDDRIVDALIERRLTLAEAARYLPAEPSAAQVADRRRAWQASLPAGTDVAQTLRLVGMRPATLDAWFVDDARYAAYLDQRFTAVAQPTRVQALAYFRDHERDFAANGVVPEFSAVEQDVRRKLAADRRAARIREWIDALKGRAEIRRIG